MFMFVQKIIFMSPFFLEILQRYYKLITLDILAVLGYTHQKQSHQPVGNCCLSVKEKSTCSVNFFKDITL